MSNSAPSSPPPLRWLGLFDDEPVAIGGSLTPESLLSAYRRGIFPWSSDPVVTWWCPNPRAVFDLQTFAVGRTTAKAIRRSGWTVAIDKDFAGTMSRCAAATSARPNTWITHDFISAYCKLHAQGFAHSIEVYEGEQPVGGLYGVAIGGFFGGESMYHQRPNASKAALSFLVEHLRQRGFMLLDAQVMNPHLASLGAVEIHRDEYLSRLQQALDMPILF